MKKSTIILMISVITLLFHYRAYSQKRNSVKINLISPLVKTVSVYYEREIYNEGSLQLGFSITDMELGSIATYKGVSVVPEYRYYPENFRISDDKKYLIKVFAAPYIKLHNANINSTALDANRNMINTYAGYSYIGGGLLFGGQLVYKDIAVVDLFLGPSYGDGDLTVKSGSEDHFAHFDLVNKLLTGISFRAGLTVGIVF